MTRLMFMRFPETRALYIIFFIGLICSSHGVLKAQDPNWSVNPSQFEHYMSLTTIVENAQAPIIDPGAVLGAFVSEECRGVASPLEVMGSWMYFLMIYSNESFGDSVSFQIFTNNEFYLISESINFGAGEIVGEPDAPHVLYTVSDLDTDEVSMAQGWSLISFDVTIENNSPSEVFEELITNGILIGVTGYDNGALFFDPELPSFLNSLTELVSGHGYWVKVASPSALSAEGVILENSFSIDLAMGWNLIGYWLEVSQSPADAFAVLIDSDIFIGATGYNNGALFYDPSLPPFLNSLTTLENSFGYWIKVDNSYDNFSYPL